jgi:hypothetical protein
MYEGLWQQLARHKQEDLRLPSISHSRKHSFKQQLTCAVDTREPPRYG